MRKSLAIRGMLATAAAALTLPAAAITGTNWVEDNEHPFVGLIVFYDAAGEFVQRCSGSLISPTKFLTAGHCTDANAGVVSARVYFQQNAGANYDPATQVDPVSGYPPGTPDQATENTRVGWLHQIFSLPVFLALPAAAAVEARHAWRRGDRVWSLYSAKSAAVSLLMFGAASAGFGQQPRLVDRAGLCQRIAVGTVFGWLTALSVRRLRATG